MSLYGYDYNTTTELVDLSIFISDITNLRRFKNLKVLHLDDRLISDISPLQYLTNLEILWLDRNIINDIRPLQNLTNLTNLKELCLGCNNISDITFL